MNRKLDELLCQEFPLLYADRHADMRTTCMCWGFDVGDGWFSIILGLSRRLEELISALPEGERGGYRASQVKEKFGGLRFYMTGQTDEMDTLIDAAEDASLVTCERCGQPGKPRNSGWIRTLCEKCDLERK
jgi:hypothetical protein